MLAYSKGVEVNSVFKQRRKYLLVPEKKAITSALILLQPKEKKKLLAFTITQTSLGFLDLVGVVAIGALGALAIQGIESHKAGNKVSTLLKVLGIQNLSFQSQVALLGIGAAGILLGKTVISIIYTKKTFNFLANQGAEISFDAISKLMSQTLTEIQKRSSQEILYIISIGIRDVMLGIIGTSITMLSDFTMLIIMSIGLFLIDPLVAATTFFLFSCIGVVLYRLLQTRAEEIGREENLLAVESNRNILEVLQSYREATVSNRKQFYVNKMGQIRYKLAAVTAEKNFQPYISKYVIETTAVLGSFALAAFEFATKNAIHAVSTLSIFMAASSRIGPAALRIQQGALMMKNSSGSAESTFKLLRELKGIQIDLNKSNAPLFFYPDFNPHIFLSSVSFRYEESSEPTLKNINLEISPGTTVAFVGPSGAGKTTLVDLLLGVLETQQGTISISGSKPSYVSQKWPGAMAYVPQSISLISGTVRENVAAGYSLELATDDRIFDALELAQLKDFILGLPDGLDSKIGEDGSMLSGGQRQRLGIARALFTQPKLLVLDEATSALDGKTEAELSSAITGLSGKTTIIIVAHRLSTVRLADQVIYLDNGNVLGTGSFDQIRNKVPDFDKQAQLMGL